MRTIGYLLGIPESAQAGIRDNTDAHLTLAETNNLIADYIDWRAEHPSDDLMTQLLHAEIEEADEGRRKLTRTEVLTYVNLIAGAGNETTTRLVGFMTQLLAEHPHQLAAVAADRSLVPDVVEETLRFEAPSPVQARWVEEDVVVPGEQVPAGSVMLRLNGSANRDERRFPEAGTFDIGPKRSHLAFGHGIHLCLGAALARLEGRVALDEMLNRWPTWSVISPGPSAHTPPASAAGRNSRWSCHDPGHPGGRVGDRGRGVDRDRRRAPPARLELAGFWVHSGSKAGKDAGEPAGTTPIGIAATQDADALIALRPDCVVYSASGPERDASAVPNYVQLLEAGINVVTTTSTRLVYPSTFNPEWREQLSAAAEKGGASLYASGIFPGFGSDHLALVLAQQSKAIRAVRVTEVSLNDHYPVAGVMMEGMGFGRPLDFSPLLSRLGMIEGSWAGPIHLIAEGLGVRVSEVRGSLDREATERDLEPGARP